jgi:spermidine/putrescine transport system substrate-binding protein
MTQEGHDSEPRQDVGRDTALTRRRFIGRSGSLALSIGGAGSFIAACGGSSKTATHTATGTPAAIGSTRRSGEVVIITWGGADKDKLVGDAFKKATGITTKFIPGDNDAAFFDKIKSSPGQYDVVISNIGFVPRYEKAGMIETLNYKDFPVYKEIYPEFLTDKRYNYVKGDGTLLAMPHQWGAYAQTYLTNLPDFKPSQPPTWEDLWRAPKGKVALDNYNVSNIALAGRMTGLPWDKVFSMQGAELDAAVKRLTDLKPFSLNTAEAVTINAFRIKKAYIGMVFSLGFASTVNRKVGRDIARSVTPKEGVLGALDGVMLLKDAPNRDNALEFLNFEPGKQVQEIFWDLYKGPTANRAATEAILARGGLDTALLKAQQGDRPDVAAGIVQLTDPDHPEAWTAAWDHIIA